MINRNAVLLGIWLLGSLVGAAQAPDSDRIGPRIGAKAEDFSGTDQFGRPQTLQSLMGRDGLMLVFFRSADW